MSQVAPASNSGVPPPPASGSGVSPSDAQPPAAAAGGNAALSLAPIDAHTVDVSFWNECARLGVSKARRSAPNTPLDNQYLHERLASLTQEDAFFSFLPYLARVVQAAGQPTRLEQSLASMSNSDELKVVALRLGVPVVAGRSFRRQVQADAIHAAVVAFAAQHPREASAALGAAVQDPPNARDAGAGVQLPPGGADALSALARRMAGPDQSPRRSPRSRSGSLAGAATPPAVSPVREKKKKRKDAPRHRRRDSSESSSSSSSSSSASSVPSGSDRQSEPSSPSSSSSSSSKSSSDSQTGSSSGDDRKSSRRHKHRRSSRHRRRRGTSSRLRREMERIGVDDPIAKEVIENILRGRAPNSRVADVIASRTYKHQRNRNELVVLARVIDCLRDRRYDAALELACRRLSGIQLADSSNSWSMADALLQNTESAADLPDSVLRRVLKSAANMTSLSQSGPRSASSSSSSRGARPKSSSGYRASSSHQAGEGQPGPSFRSNTSKSSSGGAPAKQGAGHQ